MIARLGFTGLVLAGWAVLPPYVGPALLLDPTVEFVDHVLPGLVVLAASVFALAMRSRAAGPALFATGMLVTLAGFWMTVTHVPLLAQAVRGEVSWTAAGWHSAPGLAVIAFGGVWAVRYGAAPVVGAGSNRDGGD